ncbi:oxygen-independent coproporphyrinogen III oxidase [Rubritalea marina]|uniref:oxygen-independent coproporphyrinogen III oxidase n=1 Tax=Rubritalea marina TaxID=361055 RepID=UPI00035D680D|nr:oxygen-independent coproporphyrinogen III oxidase [Rubritalea marina]
MITPDLKLVEKYNQPGPRYTSYPTAPQFTENVAAEALVADMGKSPLSLYFHLPFCASLCWFCGCTKMITSKTAPAEQYIELLEQEMDLMLPHLGQQRPVQQLHFGGGTPNHFTPEQIDTLARAIHSRFHFAEDAEISAELDPRRLTQDHIKAFARLGVNRVSFGVQDIQEKTQKAVNRVQSDEQNRDAIRWAKEAGMCSLNIDLIYGLPYQTPDSIHETLNQVLSYDPDRLAVFSYAHVPWIAPAQKILERHGLPSGEEKIKMLGVIIRELTSRGYQYIGMDHFAKVSDPLAVAQRNKTMQRNFQGYSTFHDVEICGFGISSISQTNNTYRQNVKDLNTYESMLNDGKLPLDKGYVLNQDDRMRRLTIMRLMCDHTLHFQTLSKELGIPFKDYFASELNQLKSFIADELVELNSDYLKVTPQGSLFIRNIAMIFDAHLAQSKARHSKTV